MKISEKSLRLAGIMEPIISKAVRENTTPDQVGFMTVTAIEVSGDGRVVDVFYTALNAPNNINTRLKKLSPLVAHQLKVNASLHQKLEVRFKPDKSKEHVEKMSKLMGEQL